MSPEREQLAARARAAANAQRLGMAAQGGAELAQLVEGLGVVLARDAVLARRLAPLLSAIVAAQERGDPIGLADELEHELVPALLRS